MSSFDLVREFRAKFGVDGDAAPIRARAPLAVALGAVLCVVGMSLVGPLVSKSAADEGGLFSFLFGGYRGPQQPYRPYVGHGLAPRIDPIIVTRRRHLAVKATRSTKVARRRAEPALVVANVASKFGPQQPVTTLTDSTMRRGDAVMTERGVRVFRGARHFPFETADFQTLKSAGKMPHRGSLLAIDNVLRTPLWSAAWKPSSPLVELPRLRQARPTAGLVEPSAELPQRS